MYKLLIAAPVTALLISACVVVPTDPYGGTVIAPPLPVVVELGADPYYYQSGYYYYYDNQHWRYSNSRNGPWVDLPRSHYPRETRFRGRGDRRDEDQGRDRRDRR